MREDREVDGAQSWLRQYRYSPKPTAFGPVQWLVVQLTACGLSDKEIAYVVGVSTATIKAHNCKAMRMLGLSRRGQMVRYIFETGQFAPEMVERHLALREIKYGSKKPASVGKTHPKSLLTS